MIGGEPGKVEEADTKDIEDGVSAVKTPDPAPPTAVPPGAVEEKPARTDSSANLNPAELGEADGKVSWSLSHSPRASKDAPSEGKKSKDSPSGPDPGPDAAAGAPIAVSDSENKEAAGEEAKEGEEEE